jgi:hypothetical protein
VAIVILLLLASKKAGAATNLSLRPVSAGGRPPEQGLPLGATGAKCCGTPVVVTSSPTEGFVPGMPPQGPAQTWRPLPAVVSTAPPIYKSPAQMYAQGGLWGTGRGTERPYLV